MKERRSNESTYGELNYKFIAETECEISCLELQLTRNGCNKKEREERQHRYARLRDSVNAAKLPLYEYIDDIHPIDGFNGDMHHYWRSLVEDPSMMTQSARHNLFCFLGASRQLRDNLSALLNTQNERNTNLQRQVDRLQEELTQVKLENDRLVNQIADGSLAIKTECEMFPELYSTDFQSIMNSFSCFSPLPHNRRIIERPTSTLVPGMRLFDSPLDEASRLFDSARDLCRQDIESLSVEAENIHEVKPQPSVHISEKSADPDATLRESIIGILRENKNTLTALQVMKLLSTNKQSYPIQSVNRVLYEMERRGRVRKMVPATGSKPCWRLTSSDGQK